MKLFCNLYLIITYTLVRNNNKRTLNLIIKNMKTIAEISTHKAVKTNDSIEIIFKELIIDGEKLWEDEKLYSLPLENEDDVFAIMERYEEDNRYNLAEANNEL